MSEFVDNILQPYFNFWIYVILMMIGLWALIAKNNLIKKLIGLSIFQTAIILFYVSLGVKEEATIPILDYHGEHAEHGDYPKGEGKEAHEKGAAGTAKVERSSEPPAEQPAGDKKEGEKHYSATSPDPDTMANPLPHVLMLTAIVVGVATLGVALAISQMIFREFGSLEENEILEDIKSSNTYG